MTSTPANPLSMCDLAQRWNLRRNVPGPVVKLYVAEEQQDRLPEAIESSAVHSTLPVERPL
jgi:hypothetical protein